MRINNKSLESYTAAQSSTIGWKDCVCGKSGSGGCLRLSIAGGTDFYFTTFQDETVTNNNGTDLRLIGWTMGWRVQSNGVIDNPGAAANFIQRQQEWNAGSTSWAYWGVGSNSITWNAYGGASTTIHRVLVYSERIDLITLSCV